MANVEVSALPAAQKDQLVCTYAALILHDGDLEITVSPRQLLTPIGGEARQGHQGLRQLRRVLLARPLRQGPQGQGH